MYEAINLTGIYDLLQGRLINHQSAPFVFVILNKFILSYIGSNSLCIYFIPFVCSIFSVFVLLLICRKTGDLFYVFSSILIFSLCFTATYYSTEFKQYSLELLVSLLLLYAAIKNFDEPDRKYTFFSLKRLFFYIICILCSSTAILVISGILVAEIIIVLYRKAISRLHLNYLNICILAGFIVVYYFFYLRSGNSQFMKNYWQHFFLPLNWDGFWRYWPDTGAEIFLALFGSPKFAVLILVGLTGGSFMLLRTRPELFLLFSMPVLATLAANVFFYPPGHGGAPHGGRLLLFLLPNGVLVAA